MAHGMIRLAKNLYAYIDNTGERQWYQKSSRYGGAEIRCLNAERGCGAVHRVDPKVRENFVATKR